MPAYEYVCKDCTKEFTVFLTLREFDGRPKIICPHCQSDNVQRKLGGFFPKTSRKA